MLIILKGNLTCNSHFCAKTLLDIFLCTALNSWAPPTLANKLYCIPIDGRKASRALLLPAENG